MWVWWGSGAVDDDEVEEEWGVLGEVAEAVGLVGGVAGGVADVEVFFVFAGGEVAGAGADRDNFAAAAEVGGAAEFGAGMELDLVEFDILFEVEWGEGADQAFVVGAVDMGFVVGPDDVDAAWGIGVPDQLVEGEGECFGDAHGDGEGGVGAAAFDFAEHGAADARGGGQLFEGPAPLFAQFADTGGKVGISGFDSGFLWHGSKFHYPEIFS